MIENNYDQSKLSRSPNVTQTSPLDLSKNSTQFPFRQRSPSPLDLSTTAIRNYSRQMSIDNAFEPPVIQTQPKCEWHYRSIKDLAKNHLPYLAGNGPQRTPIRVQVSC